MKNEFKLEVKSDSANERFARTVCAAFVLPLDPTLEEIDEIKTAVSEAVTNAIIHGYRDSGGIVAISGNIEDNCVTYTISDTGCGIADIEKAREPLYSGNGDPERSGMGFSIMEAFSDELKVESKPGSGTKITIVKRISDHAE